MATAQELGLPNEVRVGILGTATIARTNLRAMLDVDNVRCVAVGSRDADRAQAFAKEFEIDRSYGSYEAVLEDDEVNTVYVPLPTSAHAEWVRRAADAGKHVLCEKPCALSGKELLEMVLACRSANVLFMDGVFFMHHSRLASIRSCIDDEGALGSCGATHVTSTFSFRGDEDFFEGNIRMNKELDGLGSLGDLGWYSVRIALWAFNWRAPSFATGQSFLERDGVPADLGGSLVWAAENDAPQQPGGLPVVRSLVFHASFMHQSQQMAVISGPNGFITMHDFVIAQSHERAEWQLESRREDLEHETDTAEREAVRKVTRTESYCRQESEMWRTFAKCASSPHQHRFWSKASLLTQLCMDAVLRSATQENGARVPVDPDGLLAKFDAGA